MLFISGDLIAQTLEPRRWSHLPIDVNFIGAGTAYTFGDVFFDPVIQAEDVEMDLGILGVLHERGKWQFEATGSVFLHGDNDDFWQDTKRTQKPLGFIQGHVIYTFRPGLWASFSTGYGYGGRNTLSGTPKRDERRVSYWAISLGLPINQRQGIKIAFAASETNTDSGSSLDGVLIGWSMMFGHQTRRIPFPVITAQAVPGARVTL